LFIHLNNCEENSIAGFVRNILHIQCCVKERDVDKLSTAGLLLDTKKMGELIKNEEKVVNIAFAWKLKVFMPVDSCKLCQKPQHTY